MDDDSDWGNTGLGLTWTRNAEPDREVYTSLGFSEYNSAYYFLDTEKDYFNGIPSATRSRAEVKENTVRDITLNHRRLNRLLSGGSFEYGYQFTYLEVQNTFTDRSFSANSVRLRDSTNVSQQHSLFAERIIDFNKSYA